MNILSTLAVLICFYNFCHLTIVGAKQFKEKIQLRLYKSGKTDYEQTKISHGEILFQESKGYNQSLPLVLLIHGMAGGADCPYMNGFIDAFVERNLTNDYNIFAVDMPALMENSFKNQFYIGVLANVQPVGKTIGKFLSKVVKLQLTAPEKIHLIGYSMGAQVAGYAARVVKNRFSEINFIAGLDPAGPGFHTRWKDHPALVHVSAADARFTHFYHTNSISCGTRDRVATADFVFNRGTIQPGCTKDKGLNCSHIRVPLLYIEAVSNPKSFVARKCSSWEEFKTCNCNDHEAVPISFPPDLSAKGIYYLRTHAKSPFALGRQGSRCRRYISRSNGVHKIQNGNRNLEPHSKITRKVKYIKDQLLPKHKFKDSINMHLINGIRKMEDLRSPEVNVQLSPLSEEVESVTNGAAADVYDEKGEIPSITQEDKEVPDSNT